MFKIKQDQIFMICEAILFIFVAYSVYKYIRSLNTKINKVNNRLNMLETFIQQSNIRINSSLVEEKFEEKEKTEKESEKEVVTKQVKFDIPKPQVIDENDLIEMIEQSFIQSQQSSHSPDKIQEIPEHTNTTSFSEKEVVEEENIIEDGAFDGCVIKESVDENIVHEEDENIDDVEVEEEDEKIDEVEVEGEEDNNIIEVEVEGEEDNNIIEEDESEEDVMSVD